MRVTTAAFQCNFQMKDVFTEWWSSIFFFFLQAPLVQKTSSNRARCIGLNARVTAVKIILILCATCSHDVLICYANPLLCNYQCNSHIKVFQRHRTIYFPRDAERVEKAQVEVLAYPVAICELLNFWCCDESHFYSLYVQRINVYWAPEKRVDTMSASVCICGWVSVCPTVMTC